LYPKLYALGKVEIEQNNIPTFTEARNWFVAVDPQVTITSPISATQNTEHLKSGKHIVTVNSTHAYSFFLDVGDDINYTSTTDGGATWTAGVDIPLGAFQGLAVWYDRWTPNDNGDLIHIAYYDTAGDKIFYTQFNASTNTAVASNIDTVVNENACAGSCLGVLSGTGVNDIAVTKSTNGTIFVGTVDALLPLGSLSPIRKCSSGCTATTGWKSAGIPTTPWIDADNGDHSIVMLPLSNSSIVVISNDVLSDLLEFSTFNYASNGNWTAWTTIAPSIIDNTNAQHSLSGTVKLSNNDLYVSVVFNTNTTDSSEINVFKYNTSKSWTRLTDPWDNGTDTTSKIIDSSIGIDANSGHLYVTYIREANGAAPPTDRDVYYKVSTDDGSTWSTEQRVSDSSEYYSQVSMDNINTDRLYATWLENTNFDIEGDTVVRLKSLTETVAILEATLTKSASLSLPLETVAISAVVNARTTVKS
ncbi:MAG: hypothetical protein ACRD32_06705, partial [Nitrososphaerales archaeon]